MLLCTTKRSTFTMHQAHGGASLVCMSGRASQLFAGGLENGARHASNKVVHLRLLSGSPSKAASLESASPLLDHVVSLSLIRLTSNCCAAAYLSVGPTMQRSHLLLPLLPARFGNHHPCRLHRLPPCSDSRCHQGRIGHLAHPLHLRQSFSHYTLQRFWGVTNVVIPRCLWSSFAVDPPNHNAS